MERKLQHFFQLSLSVKEKVIVYEYYYTVFIVYDLRKNDTISYWPNLRFRF